MNVSKYKYDIVIEWSTSPPRKITLFSWLQKIAQGLRPLFWKKWMQKWFLVKGSEQMYNVEQLLNDPHVKYHNIFW